jgi:hypothetical protein
MHPATCADVPGLHAAAGIQSEPGTYGHRVKPDFARWTAPGSAWTPAGPLSAGPVSYLPADGT